MMSLALAALMAWTGADGVARSLDGASYAEMGARNMLRHHERARKAATDGAITLAAEPVFRNLRDWRSEVVAEGDGRLLLTWAADYGGAVVAEQRLTFALATLTAMNGSGRDRRTGRFASKDGNRVGERTIPQLQSTIPAGAAVLLEILP